MTEIRPARAADALRLAGPLAQLGYPGELDAVTSRLAGILKSATQQILVAAPPDDSRIDGYIGLERRLTLHQDEHVEITDLVVDATARRSGLGRALVTAGEQWAVSSWPVTSSARPPNDAGSPPEKHVIGRRTVARRVVPR
jgi:ribosomal protein S18 acetylase RimI-like enzyme